MITFAYSYPPTVNVTSGYHALVELSHDADLDEVIEAFQGFLSAAGYPMDGRVIEVVDKEKIIDAEEVR